jgi:hypothetical protein
MRKKSKGRPRHEAAFLLSLLRPRIRKQNEGTGDRRFREPAQHGARVIGVKSDIFKDALFDRAQDLDDSALKWLAPDYPDVRMVFGLPKKMLTSTEADLDPHFHRATEQGMNIGRCGSVEAESQLRQQTVQQSLLALAHGAAATTPKTSQVST